MKIFVYNNEIYSLENVIKISQASDKILHIRYADRPNDWHAISFKNGEDLARGAKEIAEILCDSQTSSNIITFDNFCFDKRYFVSAQPTLYSIYIRLGSKGGKIYESSICYSSEKKCRERFAELLKMIE